MDNFDSFYEPQNGLFLHNNNNMMMTPYPEITKILVADHNLYQLDYLNGPTPLEYLQQFQSEVCDTELWDTTSNDHWETASNTSMKYPDFIEENYPEYSISSESEDEMLTVHFEQQKIFNCNLCPFSAKQLSGLKRHMANHSDERPFKCHVCSYAAKHKDYLIKHIKRHLEKETQISEKKSGDQHHELTQNILSILKNYKKREKKEKHESNMHSPLPHLKTGAAFAQELIKRKVRVVLTRLELPYKCDICHLSFLTPADLDQHNLGHVSSVEENVATFSCTQCGAVLLNFDQMNAHIHAHIAKEWNQMSQENQLKEMSPSESTTVPETQMSDIEPAILPKTQMSDIEPAILPKTQMSYIEPAILPKTQMTPVGPTILPETQMSQMESVILTKVEMSPVETISAPVAEMSDAEPANLSKTQMSPATPTNLLEIEKSPLEPVILPKVQMPSIAPANLSVTEISSIKSVILPKMNLRNKNKVKLQTFRSTKPSLRFTSKHSTCIACHFQMTSPTKLHGKSQVQNLEANQDQSQLYQNFNYKNLITKSLRVTLERLKFPFQNMTSDPVHSSTHQQLPESSQRPIRKKTYKCVRCNLIFKTVITLRQHTKFECQNRLQMTEAQPDPVFEMTEAQPDDPVFEMTEAQPDPVFEMTEAQPDPVCEMIEAQPDPILQITEAQPNPVLQMTESQPDPVFEMTEAQPDPVFEMMEAQPDPVFEMTEAQPDPVFEMTEAQPDPVFEMTEAQPDDPVFEMTEAQPDPVFEMTEAQPDPVFEMTEAQPNPVFEMTEAQLDPVFEMTEAQPDHGLNVTGVTLKTLEIRLSQLKPTFTCEQCRLSYFTNWELQEHNNTQHIIWELEERNTQHIICEDGGYVCTLCNVRSPTLQDLTQHVTSHEQVSATFECAHCYSKFDTFNQLSNHMQGHLKNILPSDPNQSDSTTHKQVKKKKEKAIECLHCHLKLKSFKRLKKHILDHMEKNDIVEKKVSVTLNLWSLKKKNHSKTQKMFKCDQCSSVFKSSKKLKKHAVKNHKPDKKPLKVEIKLKKPVPVEKPLKKICKPPKWEKNHECPQCHAKLTSPKRLQNHMARHVGKENVNRDCLPGYEKILTKMPNEIECAHCHSKFITLEELEEHFQNHLVGIIKQTVSGDEKLASCSKQSVANKVFECNQCQQQFINQQDLTNHYQTHFNFPVNKESTYPSVGPSLNTPAHNRFECTLCRLRFESFKKLGEHFQSHMSKENTNRSNLDTPKSLSQRAAGRKTVRIEEV